MTLEEKIAFCEGKDFWNTKAVPEEGIESFMLSDGPHGLRKQRDAADMLGLNDSVPAVCFPTAVSTACSWDEELLGKVGKAIGEEARAEGVTVLLGPGANIKRDPTCGRNFEYFSEDPYLAGKLAAAYIRGVQSTGTAACLKHFTANSQEYKRFSSDSIMDERTLREIYLAAFETAVKEGRPKSLMCAYNKLNGVHCSDNKELLTDILRDEWGFEGHFVSDCWAIRDFHDGHHVTDNPVDSAAMAINAGCDLNCGCTYEKLIAAVMAGKVEESKIRESAVRLFTTRYMLGIRPEFDRLTVDPCIPAEWDGFTMDKLFRGKHLHIVVENPEHHEGGVQRLFVNGEEVAPAVLMDDMLTDQTQIRAVM